MRVDSGWGFDYGRVKYSIDLDEGNLADILYEHGIPAKSSPSSTTSARRMPSSCA
jgi:hypothetical protein